MWVCMARAMIRKRKELGGAPSGRDERKVLEP